MYVHEDLRWVFVCTFIRAYVRVCAYSNILCLYTCLVKSDIMRSVTYRSDIQKQQQQQQQQSSREATVLRSTTMTVDDHTHQNTWVPCGAL